MLYLVSPSCPALCDPVDCSPQTPLSVGILQARMLEWVAMSSSRGSSNLGIKPRSHALQTDSLPSVPPGKPRNTEVGSLSLLQGIFLTQELNQGVLHCRPILYQQSYREAQECRRPKLKFMLLTKKSSGFFFFSVKVYILSLFNFNLWWS